MVDLLLTPSVDFRLMKLGLNPKRDTSPVSNSRFSIEVAAPTRSDPNKPLLMERIILLTGRFVSFESSEILMPSQTSTVGTVVEDLPDRGLAYSQNV